MKTWKQSVLFGMVAIIALSFGFAGCDNGDGEQPIYLPINQPKNQTATISLTFDKAYTATIKGNLTDTEWNGISGKIENAINARYAFYVSKGYDGLMDDWKKVFNLGVTIIVEKTTEYSKWKTTTDGKTMYLNFVSLDTDLQETLDWAVGNMSNSTADKG